MNVTQTLRSPLFRPEGVTWRRFLVESCTSAPVAAKEPEKGKNYFGLYLLVGGLKPYTISDMETTIPLAKTHDPLHPGRFLRGLGPRLQMKLMAIPVGRSLVFSGC